MKYYMNIYNILLKKIIMTSGELFQQKTRLSASVSLNRKGGRKEDEGTGLCGVCEGREGGAGIIIISSRGNGKESWERGAHCCCHAPVPNTTHWGAAGDYTQPLVGYYMAKED